MLSQIYDSLDKQSNDALRGYGLCDSRTAATIVQKNPARRKHRQYSLFLGPLVDP